MLFQDDTHTHTLVGRNFGVMVIHRKTISPCLWCFDVAQQPRKSFIYKPLRPTIKTLQSVFLLVGMMSEQIKKQTRLSKDRVLDKPTPSSRQRTYLTYCTAVFCDIRINIHAYNFSFGCFQNKIWDMKKTCDKSDIKNTPYTQNMAMLYGAPLTSIWRLCRDHSSHCLHSSASHSSAHRRRATKPGCCCVCETREFY